MKFLAKKPFFEREIGDFKLNVYFNEKKLKDCYATINAKSGNWHLKVTVASGAYNYLLGCIGQEDWRSIEMWLYYIYATSCFLGNEEEFSKDIITAINNYIGRLEKQAAEDAEKVTEQDEMIADAELRDDIEYAKMSKTEREERKEQVREAIRESLSDVSEVAKPKPKAKRKPAKKTKSKGNE